VKYAIISDLHANVSALKAVLADIAEMNVDSIICLGDIVGYGPLPEETLLIVKNKGIVSVRGNHDDAVSGIASAEEFAELAREAAERHRRVLSEDEIKYLKSLPYSISLEGNAVAVHGDAVDPAKFYYVESDEDAAENFACTDAQFIFVGHTHTPWIFASEKSSDEIYSAEPSTFTAEENWRYIVNPGSVGYPREKDGKCYSSYVVFDSEEKTVSYRFLPFSVASVMQRGCEDKKPRKRKFSIIHFFALVFGIALLAALIFFVTPFSAPEKGSVPTVKEQQVSFPAEKYFAKKTVRLVSDKKSIKPNLILDTKNTSAPVLLKIKYRDLKGDVLAVETFTVKKSIRRVIKLPATAKNATEVELIIVESHPGSRCSIEKFEPLEAKE
jgi:predicted phosphodiesterase